MTDDHSPPPPPYSETDLYSSHPGSTSPHEIFTPGASHADDVSFSGRPVSQAASSTGDPVYTPSYTTTESEFQGLGEDHDRASVSSAAAYFESRPTFGSPLALPLLVHKLMINSSTLPKDLPYPQPEQNWLSRDVTRADWDTFLNHLFPDHAASVNNDVASRKFDAELLDKSMKRLDLGHDNRSRTVLAQVDAQLDPLRQSRSSQRPHIRTAASIVEWNENFFQPRRVQIELVEPGVPEEEVASRIPGAWVPNEQEIPQSRSADKWAPRGIFGGFRGFRVAMAADRNGVRMGSERLRGFSQMPSFHDKTHEKFTHGHHSRGHGHGHGHGHGRGRGHGHGFRGRRGRSHSQDHKHCGRSSSTSSSSSSSSSDSDASVGSLPDYDNIKDQQLPAAKQSLLEWLDHPEKPITKETVSQIRQNIKIAKNCSRNTDQDMKELRQEVGRLMKDFKHAKKAQKANTRAARRERRAVRRAAKKERRELKREERRAWKEGRKGKHREDGMPFPPWMAGKNAIPPTTPVPPFPMMKVEFGSMSCGRAGPSIPVPPRGPPGMSAMHGGWPFTRNIPYEPGSVAAPQPPNLPTSISKSAEQINLQAQQMEANARRKEDRATQVRVAATAREVSEKTKLRSFDEATELEEEAEKFRREADRLRAEALHLDEELARELEDEHSIGQWGGLVPF